MSKQDKTSLNSISLDFNLTLNDKDNEKIRSDALRKVKEAIADRLHEVFIKENKHFEIKNGPVRQRLIDVTDAFLDTEYVDKYIENSMKRQFEALADQEIAEMIKRGVRKRAVSKIQEG